MMARPHQYRGAAVDLVGPPLGVLPDKQFAHDGVSDHADLACHFIRVLAS